MSEMVMDLLRNDRKREKSRNRPKRVNELGDNWLERMGTAPVIKRANEGDELTDKIEEGDDGEVRFGIDISEIETTIVSG